ncbi:MAG TPA: hypothetical protein VFB54_04290 [Burkholderiales bacterium]|nr:hypothetical protein [Burkholderiales bacterium]
MKDPRMPYAGPRRAIDARGRIRAALVGSVLALACAPAHADRTADFARAQKLVQEGDVVRALPLLRRMADEGYAPAQARLADLLDKAEENEAAVSYYRKAAEQGDADGLFGLASMYASGEGVAQNMPEAFRLLRLAAEKSHTPAIHALARGYIAAHPALAADKNAAAEALRWNSLAAESGFVPAMDALARAYRSGEWGAKTDAGQAEAWERRAEAARRALASSGSSTKPEKR